MCLFSSSSIISFRFFFLIRTKINFFAVDNAFFSALHFYLSFCCVHVLVGKKNGSMYPISTLTMSLQTWMCDLRSVFKEFQDKSTENEHSMIWISRFNSPFSHRNHCLFEQAQKDDQGEIKCANPSIFHQLKESFVLRWFFCLLFNIFFFDWISAMILSSTNCKLSSIFLGLIYLIWSLCVSSFDVEHAYILIRIIT